MRLAKMWYAWFVLVPFCIFLLTAFVAAVLRHQALQDDKHKIFEEDDYI
ncbi:MAG TPA: hypothetical protein PKV96_03350 [Candidatus Saccharimonas sp.]|nr:hypothetical protein [Candidatus Saccharimonas sp.]